MKTRQGKALLLGLLATGGVAIGGTIAWKLLSNRTGEGALQYIPSDSMVVMTFDTAPSARQAVTMNEISAALQREGLDKKFDDMVVSLLQGQPVANELRQHLSTSYAMTSWKGKSGTPEMAVFFSVKDKGKVEELVKKGVTKESVVLNVLNDYLVITSTADAFERILQVRDGKIDPFTKNTEFQPMRLALPEDANYMLFVDQGKVAEAASETMKEIPAGRIAVSLTIEPQGLAIDTVSTIKSTDGKQLVGDVQPLNAQEVERLPKGAYGFAATQALGKTYRPAFDSILSTIPEAKKSVDEFEKKSGLSIENDLIPFFSGTTSFSVVPGTTGKPEDIDIVTRFEGDGEATSRVFKAIRRLIMEEAPSSNNPKPKFTEIEVGGKPAYESSIFGPGKSDVMSQKTLLMAEFDNGGAMSTSRARLESMITMSNSLKDDPSASTILKSSNDGANTIFQLNHGRIIALFLSKIDEQFKGQGITGNDLMEAFGGRDAGISVSAKKDGEFIRSRCTIPMNYDRLISLIGKGSRGASEGAQLSPPSEEIK